MKETPKEIPNARNGFYFYEDEPKLCARVTTILGEGLPKAALVPWAARTSARAALANPSLSEQECVSAIYGERDEAKNLGLTVHTFVEAWRRGNTPPLENVEGKFVPYAKAFISFTKRYPFTFLTHEVEVRSRKYAIAGRTDIVAQDPEHHLWLLDVKTGKNVYREAGLQLAAYKVCYEETGGEAAHKIDKMGVVHLKDDGTFSLIETNEPFEVFLHIKSVWEWLEADKIAEVKKFAELKKL